VCVCVCVCVWEKFITIEIKDVLKQTHEQLNELNDDRDTPLPSNATTTRQTHYVRVCALLV
jgi:hypothetical protein